MYGQFTFVFYKDTINKRNDSFMMHIYISEFFRMFALDYTVPDCWLLIVISSILLREYLIY
jgi:hypothetical protein